MAIEVFNRYENKYLVDELTMFKIQNRFNDYMKPDAYNKDHDTYKITNLYYDTDDSSIIRASLSKPKYKEKLRMRAYGTPTADSKVYVEIKKKVYGLVNKRRTAMTLDEAYGFLSTGEVKEIKSYMNKQVINELSYILEREPLKPAVYLSYDRRAYFGSDGSDLRVSFDTNIVSRRRVLALEYGSFGELLLPEGQWLMEIKCSNSIPFWMCRLLSEFKIYPTSFSKYGTEYKNSLENGDLHREEFIPVYEDNLAFKKYPAFNAVSSMNRRREKYV